MRRTPCRIGDIRPICCRCSKKRLLSTKAGSSRTAESSYLHILEAKPDHGHAQRLLGILRHQQGRHAEALDLIDGALNADAD